MNKDQVRLWKIPEEVRADIKEEFGKYNWPWLAQKWNDYDVTTDRICPTCDGTVKILIEYLPKLWENDSSDK